MVNFNIQVVSDTVCPWCYIGQRHLSTAISQFLSSSTTPTPAHTFTTTWSPFYLNPNSPPYPGTPKLAALSQKFPPQLLPHLISQVSTAGSAAGIKFNYDNGNTGSTRDSHILLELVRSRYGPVAQDKVVQRVFKGYFEDENGNITDVSHLAKWASEAGVEGLDERVVKGWFGVDGEGSKDDLNVREEAGKIVDRETRWASEGGISGVPNFKINDRYVIGGAQPVEEFVKLFKRIEGEEERAEKRRRETLEAREKEEEAGVKKGEDLVGQACEIGGKC